MTQSDVLWAARVWKRRMYRCCNGSSLSPQDMHCLHWKSLEARSSFHVSHYLQGLILFDTMEEDGRCFPERECFPCMHMSYLSAMAQRWCCSIFMCLDGGGVRHWCPKLSVTYNVADNTGNVFKWTVSGAARLLEIWAAKLDALVRSWQCLCGRIYAKEMAEKPQGGWLFWEPREASMMTGPSWGLEDKFLRCWGNSIRWHT